MTVGAASAEETHTGLNGSRITLERVLWWNVLSGEQAAPEHAEYRDRQHPAHRCHTQLLVQCTAGKLKEGGHYT